MLKNYEEETTQLFYKLNSNYTNTRNYKENGMCWETLHKVIEGKNAPCGNNKPIIYFNQGPVLFINISCLIIYTVLLFFTFGSM